MFSVKISLNYKSALDASRIFGEKKNNGIFKGSLKDLASLQCYVSVVTCSSITEVDSALPNPTTPSFSMLLTRSTRRNSLKVIVLRTHLKN